MSSLRVRMSYRFLSSVGATQTSLHATFDECHDQYQKLRTSTIQFRDMLQRYLGQIAELHEITERLSLATEGFFVEGDPNNGLATSFREFCWESRYGFITHLVDGVKKGVLDPFNLWQREIDKAQEYVDGFQDIRLKYDHYRLKVQQLSQKMEAEFGRNSKTVEKYNRNALKLQEATKEYKTVSEDVCKHLVTLLRKRYTTLNPIFIRFVQFLQLYYAHWNMLATDLGSTFEEEIQSIEPMGLESFVPKTAVKHHEGLLHKKGQMGVRDREMFCQLVGSTMLMFDSKQQSRVGETPHKIADVAYVTEWDGKGSTGFGLVNAEGREYYFWTETEEQQKAWLAALERARTWDGMASKDNITEKLDDLRAVRQAVASSLNSEELLPKRYTKKASKELNLPNLTAFEENVALPVEASADGAMSQIQAAIAKGGPPTHPKLNANAPAGDGQRQSLISKILPFGRGDEEGGGGQHRSSSVRRSEHLGAIPEGEEGADRPESMSSSNSDSGFFNSFKRAVSRKMGSSDTASTPERSTSPTPPPHQPPHLPPGAPPPPPPRTTNRHSETDLERPSEMDFGAAPEVGEDVYMVFSQLAGSDWLVFDQLFQWPELIELLETNALSQADVQELWEQASLPGPDGGRRMDAKGFDTFVSLCDERQLVNQGEA